MSEHLSPRDAEPRQVAGQEQSKPEVTNPKNLAPVDPTESREQREDIRAAIFETRLRRWALLGFILAAVVYFVWQVVSG